MEQQRNVIYSEVYTILNLLGQNYINKLPINLYKMIEKNAMNSKTIKYTSLSEIDYTNTSKESIAMIALLHYNYWCEFQGEQNEIKLLLKNNSIDNENKKRKKYNPDIIFEKNNITDKNINNISDERKNMYKIDLENTNVPAIPKKSNYLSKVLNFFLKLFNKTK